MNIKHHISIAAVLILIAFPVNGQNPMGLYFMETIPQSSQMNPAMQPRANGFFAFPSVNLMFQSDVAFNDAFQEQGGEWVSPLSKRFNYDDLYSSLGKAANINTYADVDIFGLGFRTGRDYLSFTMSIKSVMQSGLPSDLLKSTEIGFPDGQSFDLSSIGMKHVAYHELAFGYSREWNDQFSFGIKFKPLFGIAGGYSKIDQFQINTSRTQWDLIVDGTIHTSAPLEVEEGEPRDFPEDISSRDLTNDETSDYFTSFQNGGMAFDFGTVYEHDEAWTFSAAFTNLGYVKFKNDLNSLSFDGTYAFDGISVEGTEDDEIEQAFEDIVDSLETVIEYDLTHEKFSIPLTPSLYVGASYIWTPSVSFGLLARSTFQKHNYRQDFNLSMNIQPYNFIALNLNYSKRIKGGSGLGTAISVLTGPFQFFLAADYIPMRYANVSFDDGDSFAMPYKHKDLSFRFGLNLIFGRHGYRNEPMLSVN